MRRAVTPVARVLVAACVCGCLNQGTLSAQTASLEALLKLGADYVAAYAPRVSGVILEEHYVLIEIGAGTMMTPRRIASDVVLINLNDEAIALRDAFAIDNRSLRDRAPRINALLETPSGKAWILAQDYARQSQVHFGVAIVVQASEPVLALRFLSAAHQPSLRFRLDGRKKLNGVAVAGVRFEEPRARDAKHLLNTRGNASASGRFWLDPATGAVHQTELWAESKTEVARVSVTYAPDPNLGLLLPTELVGTFEERVLGIGPDAAGSSVYNVRQLIESTATYSNARLVPIDLRKIRRPAAR